MAQLRTPTVENDTVGRATVLGLALLAITWCLVVITGAPAHASNGKPTTRENYYVDTTSTSRAYDLGCDKGQNIGTGGTEIAVLDFGGQNSTNSGTKFINGTSVTYSTIRGIAEQFARGFWVCTGGNTGATMDMGLGTNNSYYSVSSSGGSTWASEVNTVQSWINSNAGQVVAYGADDIEPGFGSYTNASAWVGGFDGHGVLYYNYGSADGCSQTEHGDEGCSNGWTTYRVWYVSWGASGALSTPEIYYSSQAHQWAEINLYGKDSESNGIAFSCPWDQYPLDHSTYTSQGAWDALKADSGESPPFSCEIEDE